MMNQLRYWPTAIFALSIALGSSAGAAQLEPHFRSIKALIIDKSCLFCHSAGGEAEKVPFSTYSEILNSPREVVLPKRPDESGMVLFTETSDADPKRMPPVDSGLPRLTHEETTTIRQWITDGAKDD